MFALRLPVATSMLSRRFARAGSGLALLAGLTTCAEGPVTPSRVAPDRDTPEGALASVVGRPSIVVIMTDDQTVENMRALPQVRTLIGSAGATFDNSIVTYALCCPSRATFLTGQYAHNHGVRSNGAPDGGHARLDHTNTLPVWLQEAGYVTGHVGKYLNGYGDVDTLEVPPGWTEWYAVIGRFTNRYFDFRVNENGTVLRYEDTPENYQTDLFTQKALDFISRRAPDAAAGVSPFFLTVAYLAPHWGRPVEPGDPVMETPVPAPRHKGLFAGQVLPASPAFNEADVSDKPSSMRSLPLLTATKVSELQEAYRQRLESLLAVDEGVARIVGALQDAGILRNTLLIFTSDNGWFQGEHRVDFGKTLPYEPAVKVPLLVSGAGVVPGLRVTAAVGNIDLAPTIVEAAGATARRIMDGRSLWPFLSGGQTTWSTGNGPRHLLVEDSQRGTRATVFWSIRRGTFVYTEYANGNRELYDLRTDSAQVSSRHADTKLARVRQELAARLARIKTCSGPVACW